MASRPFVTRIPALLFAAALVTSLPVLWFFATPILDASEAPAHVRHGATLYLHVLGGLPIIVAGAGALYIGWTKRVFKRHKWFGYTYLGLGTVMALSALALLLKLPTNPGAYTWRRALSPLSGWLSLQWHFDQLSTVAFSFTEIG
ncbi:MAG TPA: hypothetical protein VEZ20_11780 [Allosphingosinicella sp.]|jgi:hypothetical protein|nr:hypothetical protein [Allosphingosinicella sp.]